ncbi:MAG TPA: hypothetical protein VF586_02655 [Pyrinomonadaceae bacterium]|jgi:opacity protein-like surface antigen
MKRRTLLASTLLTLACIAAGVAAEVSPPNGSSNVTGGERIRFQITAVEESGAGREVISDAAVEGPPGTDFNVNLQDGRFQVSARFMSDLARGGGLTLRARLDTRRLYGHSESGLPLYEEDAQRHTLNLDFDETVVLLPFGGGGDAGRLSIEIKPARLGSLGGLSSGDANTPDITISKPSPGGAISIEATKVPHDYVVEATLLEDGREVARGSADCLLEEPRELPLRTVGAGQADGDAVPLALNLSVERFEPGAGAGRAAVRFDLLEGGAGRAALARNWAGVAHLGSELAYDLGQTYRVDSGRRYELRLRVELARGDRVGR